MRGELVGALARRRRPDRPASSAASRVRDAARDDGAVCSVFLQRLIVVACRRARGRGARAKLRQIERLEQFITRAERVVEQIQQRMRGERITNRLVSIFGPGRATDPQGQAPQAERLRVRDAELRGDREHPARRARLIAPTSSQVGNPQEKHAAASDRRGIRPAASRPGRVRSWRSPRGMARRFRWASAHPRAQPGAWTPDLRMDEQAARVLLSATGLEISDDGVGELVRRPEGWSAGLYLAALSAATTGVAPGEVAALTGKTRSSSSSCAAARPTSPTRRGCASSPRRAC